MGKIQIGNEKCSVKGMNMEINTIYIYSNYAFSYSSLSEKHYYPRNWTGT